MATLPCGSYGSNLGPKRSILAGDNRYLDYEILSLVKKDICSYKFELSTKFLVVVYIFIE